MAPVGLGDEARAALRSRGQCWGVLCLHREDGVGGFDEDELALLSEVAPLFGEGLRRALAVSNTAAGEVVPGGPGVLILDAQLRLISSNRQAEQWLGQVDDSEWIPSFALPAAVVSAAAATIERDDGAPPARRTIVRRSGGGWMTVDASRLSGTGSEIVVVLDSADPEEVTPFVLAAYGLTPAQCRVAALVLRGRSTQQIVNELGISAYTVQEHLGAVFERFGIGSRRELVAALTMGH
jgi:DNA-binding CsgD family transcriptional regulator